jgi:hypothetical protein
VNCFSVWSKIVLKNKKTAAVNFTAAVFLILRGMLLVKLMNRIHESECDSLLTIH